MCNKKSYNSKEEAIDVINHQLREHNAVYLRTYYCIQCNAWHITKQRESNKRKMKYM